MIRRPATTRPIPSLFRLLVLIGALAMQGEAVTAPALAQGPDAAVVVIQADHRHLRPDIASTTFGEEVAPGQSNCTTITYHLYGHPQDLKDYALSLRVDVNLRSGKVVGTVSGGGTRESVSGTATCTWEGTADQEPHVTFLRDRWRFRAGGEVTLRCTGQYACAGAKDAQGNRITATGTVEHAIPFEIAGEASPGEDPRLYIRGALSELASNPPITWYFNLLSTEDPPPLGAPFPAYPLAGDAETPAAAQTATRHLPTATVTETTPTPPGLTPTTGIKEGTPSRIPSPTARMAVSTPGAPQIPAVVAALTGENAQPPTAVRAAAAAVASAGVLAVGAAARLIGGHAATSSTKGTPAQGSGQANQLQAMRARWTQALTERIYSVMTLETERDRLDRRIRDLDAQHRLECTTGAVDGIFDGANLLISIVGGPATAAGAGGLNAFWDGGKLGVRAAAARRLATASGIDPLASPAKMAAGAAGIPLKLNAPGGALGHTLQNAAARRPWAVIRGMGRALGPLQSGVAMGQNAHSHARRTAWLRSQLKGARSRRALVNRQLMDARGDADEARSALNSTNDAIRQLKAQFPRRFTNL